MVEEFTIGTVGIPMIIVETCSSIGQCIISVLYPLNGVAPWLMVITSTTF